jgi:hypothetical protein
MPKRDEETEIEEVKEEAMPKKAASKSEPSLEGLVKVSLGSETLHVHPNALADHKKLGWKEA